MLRELAILKMLDDRWPIVIDLIKCAKSEHAEVNELCIQQRSLLLWFDVNDDGATLTKAILELSSLQQYVISHSSISPCGRTLVRVEIYF